MQPSRSTHIKTAALRDLLIGALTPTQIAEKFGITPHQIEEWRAELIANLDRALEPVDPSPVSTQEKHTLQTVLNALNDGVALFDLRTQQVRYANAPLLTMIDCTPAELIGRSTAELQEIVLRFCPAYWDLQATFWQNGSGQHVWITTTTCYGRNREPFDAQATVILLPAADGTLEAVVVVRDISQGKRLEAQRDRFMSIASHELRTPVTNLKLRMYMMLEQPDMIPRHLPMMEQSIERLHRLIETMLETTRFEYGLIELHRTACTLQTVIDYVIDENSLRAIQKSIVLHVEYPPEPIVANIDEDRMIQALTNLVTNGILYTPAGGDVTVTLWGAFIEETPHAFIRITDNGVSIPESALPHLFDPFYRAGNSKEKGTGLGLTITKEIIEIHGGSIAVTSEKGRGSEFTIGFPINIPLPVAAHINEEISP